MLHGEEVVKYSAHDIHPKRCQVALEQLPEKLVEKGVEALVIDTIHFRRTRTHEHGYAFRTHLERASYRWFGNNSTLFLQLATRDYSESSGQERRGAEADRKPLWFDIGGGTVLCKAEGTTDRLE